MNKRSALTLAALVAISVAACTRKAEKTVKAEQTRIEKFNYPQTRKMAQTDDYHGTKVEDPYRWLEDDRSAETAAWVEAENKVTRQYLDAIPGREAIKNRLTELWNYTRYGVPEEHNGKLYYFKNDGLQNQSVLYEIVNGEEKLLLDPNKFSTDGTVALGGIEFNKAGDKMGYIINRSGSDWQEIYVMDVKTRTLTGDKIKWAKFSGIAWKGEGFFYSRYDEPKEGQSDLSAANTFQKVYYHKLGTSQAEDVLVFEDKERPRMGWSAQVSEDERYVFIYGTEGASTGNELYFSQFGAKTTDLKFKKIFGGTKYNYSVVDMLDGRLLVLTDRDAPRYKLVMIDPNYPEPRTWINVVAQSPDMVIQSARTAGGKIFITAMKDAYNKVLVYNEEGGLEREIGLPTIGTVSGFNGKRESKTLYFSFTSFTYPSVIYSYDIATGKSQPYRGGNAMVKSDDYLTSQVMVTSKDGTKVPMFIVRRRDVQLNGKLPTYLYAYGGFNISLNPGFSAARMLLLEQGGVLAVANLRGGGEYGETWHQAGMLGNKQNVFDDFIASAQYLIDNNYTSPAYLAIAGGSNGGLLVGACMTQRPELFKVAFPAVGVLDMLRYQKFTIGHAWVPEYGSADTAEHFKWLIKYSPLHNVKKGVNYPATLITTGDHDDRVVPAHSFKFAATLQEKNTGPNPMLIRIETNAGHGAGKPTAKQIDEWTDIWTFMLSNMGIGYKQPLSPAENADPNRK